MNADTEYLNLQMAELLYFFYITKGIIHLHLHLVIKQTLLSKATYNWEYIERLILKRQTYRGSANNTMSQALFK